MDRPETFAEIADILAGQEEAINKHPPRTSALYARSRDALVEAWTKPTAATWFQSAPMLSDNEAERLVRYMIASSFISAWYHSQGIKARRDQAARSCSMLVSSLGPDSELVFRQYLHFEELWRDAMKREGVAQRGLRRFVGPLILGALILLVLKFCV